MTDKPSQWHRLSLTSEQVEKGEADGYRTKFDAAFTVAGAPRVMALFRQERDDGGTDLFATPDSGIHAPDLLREWGFVPCDRPSLIRLHLLIGHNEITYYMP